MRKLNQSFELLSTILIALLAFISEAKETRNLQTARSKFDNIGEDGALSFNKNHVRKATQTQQKQPLRTPQLLGWHHIARNLDEGDDDEVKTSMRIIIQPFHAFFTPVLYPFTSSEIDTILNAMEYSLVEYLRARKSIYFPPETELELVRIGNVISNFFNPQNVTSSHSFDNNTNSLFIERAIVSFHELNPSGFESISEDNVNSWIHEALNGTDFASFLKNYITQQGNNVSLTFQMIETVKYEFPKEYPMEYPKEPTVVGGNAGTETKAPSASAPIASAAVSNDTPDNSPSAAVIVPSVVVGMAAVTLLSFFFIQKRRTKSEVEVDVSSVTHDLTTSNRKQPPNSPGNVTVDANDSMEEGEEVQIAQSPPHLTSASIIGSNRNRSILNSESEFTVSTETNDTTVLKTIHNLGHAGGISEAVAGDIEPILSPTFYEKNTSHAYRIGSADSFELDRQITVRKDMLTNVWMSGKNDRGKCLTAEKLQMGNPSHIQSESVLQPSYFSAAEERIIRKMSASAKNRKRLDDFEMSSNDSSSSSSAASSQNSGITPNRVSTDNSSLTTADSASTNRSGSAVIVRHLQKR